MPIGDRFRRWLESGEKVGFRLAAKGLFLAIVTVLAIISFAANLWVVAVIAALLVGLMLRAVLPTSRIQSWARSLWTGEAGDRWRRRWEGLLSRLLPALVIAFAGLLIATPPIATASTAMAVAGPPPADVTSCRTVVVHDAFRDDPETVSTLANSSRATSTVKNTRVSIEETDAFYRLRAQNPNGYCVHFRVLVAAEAMRPASIPGKVKSNKGNHSATWDAVHDFNTSETYTRVEVTIPPATTATFSPSRYRVMALSWASQSQSTTQSALDKVKSSVLGDPTVTKRHYEFRATSSEVPTTYTVRLRDPHTGAKLESYHALYSTDNGDSWRPIGTDTEAAVYKQEVRNGSAVRFHFNEPAQVKFTANPSMIDDAQRQWKSYDAGIDQMVDSLLEGLGLSAEDS